MSLVRSSPAGWQFTGDSEANLGLGSKKGRKEEVISKERKDWNKREESERKYENNASTPLNFHSAQNSNFPGTNSCDIQRT